MKRVYFGTNLKMYKNIRMTHDYLVSLEQLTKDISRDAIKLFVIPSYTSLPEAVKCVDQSLIQIGAQNMGWEDEGQFTGEISPLMLEELGIHLIMAGHSERRHVFLETDEMENRKVLCALHHGFTALLCIGETGGQKEGGISREVLRTQLKLGFKGVDPQMADHIVVAYEPVWAIGVHGKPASVEYAEEMHSEIRTCLDEIFGRENSAKIPVLYGGSVNMENAVPLIRQEHIDGLYVGRSAWHADQFNTLIRACLSSLSGQ